MIYRIVSSASAAAAIKDLIICAMVNIGPLIFRVGSFSDRNIKAPARLRAFESRRNPTSECVASIILLAQKNIIIRVCSNII